MVRAETPAVTRSKAVESSEEEGIGTALVTGAVVGFFVVLAIVSLILLVAGSGIAGALGAGPSSRRGAGLGSEPCSVQSAT